MNVVAIEGRRERRKRELRTRIYETARQLFMDQGFEATTVAQIADAVDIAQATFFNHFASKQAVLTEMTAEVSEYLMRLVDAQLARPVSALERIRGFADSVASELSEARGLARDVLLELMQSGERPGEAYPYLARAHGPFTSIIRQGQKNGEVRADHSPEFLADMVLGCLNVAVTRWIVDPEFSVAESLSEISDFVNGFIQTSDASASRPASREVT